MSARVRLGRAFVITFPYHVFEGDRAPPYLRRSVLARLQLDRRERRRRGHYRHLYAAAQDNAVLLFGRNRRDCGSLYSALKRSEWVR